MFDAPSVEELPASFSLPVGSSPAVPSLLVHAGVHQIVATERRPAAIHIAFLFIVRSSNRPGGDANCGGKGWCS